MGNAYLVYLKKVQIQCIWVYLGTLGQEPASCHFGRRTRAIPKVEQLRHFSVLADRFLYLNSAPQHAPPTT